MEEMYFVKFEIFTAVKTPCSVVVDCQGFGCPYCLSLQGEVCNFCIVPQNYIDHNPEDLNLVLYVTYP
jgi:hypothetical protein